MGDVNDNEEKSSQKESERAETPGCFELLIVTTKQMRKKKQFLLIPLTIWSGLEQGFFGADFTAVRYLSSDTVQDFLNKCSGNKHFFTRPCHRQTYQSYDFQNTLFYKNVPSFCRLCS